MRPHTAKKYAEFDSFWKQNEQRLRDIQKFEGLKGVTYDFLNASHAQAALLADAPAEIARLRGALEEINRTTFDDDANRIAHGALQK